MKEVETIKAVFLCSFSPSLIVIYECFSTEQASSIFSDSQATKTADGVLRMSVQSYTVQDK
jgi:hypothetical protein